MEIEKIQKQKNNEQTYNPVHSVYMKEPDYKRPGLEISDTAREKILRRLSFLYGEEQARWSVLELFRIMKVHYAHKSPYGLENDQHVDPTNRFTEKDIILITYGDLIRGGEGSPISTLARFCKSYLEGTINTLHILPFFPYSSDRGFSVTDFETVDPNLGSWEDIEELENRYQLMFDGVFNHVSSKSKWFQEFLNGHPQYKNFFIHYGSKDELSDADRRIIFRPRTSDILTRYYGLEGQLWTWTTFSEDQIDLNYKNPSVLLRVIEILLLYVRHGADIIRLDAVTYLWSEPGTSCIHLDQTHEIVKLMRDIMNVVAPGVAVITETNVPHDENISYFGNGYDEAQMVYNFALPPLVLHTFYSGNSTHISQWADTLDSGSECTTFFNFLDSHDGIGLMAVKNILSKDEIKTMVDRAEKDHGGFVSYKATADGEEPYEINITWYSALNRRDDDDHEDRAFHVKRFVASRSIALILKGVPGVYLHSLLGTRNDVEAVTRTNSKRDINRTVLDYNSINEQLQDPFSRAARINRELGRLLTIRTGQSAFHPNAAQRVLQLSSALFIVLRVARDFSQHLIAITNITNSPQQVSIPLRELSLPETCITETHWYDLVSEMDWIADKEVLHLSLEAYDVMWLVGAGQMDLEDDD